MTNEPKIGPGHTVGGRFVIRSKLGSGGFGSVWLAQDRQGGPDVALKLLHPKYLDNSWVRERFDLEAEVLLQLDHPGIAKPVEAGVDGENVFLAMAFAEGRSLDLEIGDRAAAERHYTPIEVAEIMDAICQAVAHAHDLTIVHRDLKPKNIQVDYTRGFSLKILDFGVAKILADTGRDATTVGRLLGSLLYLSPEQATSRAIDPRADVFSIGTLLFELVTLRRAWAWGLDHQPLLATNAPISKDHINNHFAILRRIAKAPRPKIRQCRPELSVALEDVVAKAMAIEPSERYASALALAAAYRAAVGLGPATVQQSPSMADTFVPGGGRTTIDDRLAGQSLVDADEEDEGNLTSVMPSNQDERDLVRDSTRAVTSRSVHDTSSGGGWSLDSSSSPRIATFSGPHAIPAANSNRQMFIVAAVLVAGVALGIGGTVAYMNAQRTPVQVKSLPAPPTPAKPVARPPSPSARGARAPSSAPPTKAPTPPPTKAKSPSPTRTSRRTKTGAAPSKRTATPTPAPVHSELKRLLRQARANPDDFAALERLHAAIEKAAGKLPAGAAKTAIKRRLSTSGGELGPLEDCARRLMRATQTPR